MIALVSLLFSLTLMMCILGLIRNNILSKTNKRFANLCHAVNHNWSHEGDPFTKADIDRIIEAYGAWSVTDALFRDYDVWTPEELIGRQLMRCGLTLEYFAERLEMKGVSFN